MLIINKLYYEGILNSTVFYFSAVTVTQDSATLGKDFNGDLVTLYFASGEASVSTTFDIINDGEPEDSEDFIVSLRVLEGGILGPINKITVTILDDERPLIPQTYYGNFTNIV